MTKTITKKTTYLILGLLLPFYAYGQSEEKPYRSLSSWSMHAKYGVPFFPLDIEPTYSSFETSLSTKPTRHIIIGGGYSYPWRKNLSLDVGFSYEYGNFVRNEEYSYIRFNGERRSGIIDRRFQTHSFLSPIKLSKHYKRMSLSIGIVNTFHLAARVGINHSFFTDGQFSSESNKNFRHGDRRVIGSGIFIDRINVNLVSRFNIQALLSADFQLTNRVSLNFEARQYVKRNQLEIEHHHYDVSKPAYTYYNPFVRTFSVGLRYHLKS